VAEEAGVALEATVAEAVAINGNRELIGQALSNIVDNAIKYSTGAAESPKVLVSLARAGGEAKLTVTDNGHGIPDDTDR
ncbi:MAG: two-component sensor histidine kinase, partial [Mesorhizobium sp.]